MDGRVMKIDFMVKCFMNFIHYTRLFLKISIAGCMFGLKFSKKKLIKIQAKICSSFFVPKLTEIEMNEFKKNCFCLLFSVVLTQHYSSLFVSKCSKISLNCENMRTNQNPTLTRLLVSGQSPECFDCFLRSMEQ